MNTIVYLGSLTTEQTAGLQFAVDRANAARPTGTDPVTLQEYVDKLVGDMCASYEKDRLESLRQSIIPMLDESKVVGLLAYFNATPDKQLQIKTILDLPSNT